MTSKLITCFIDGFTSERKSKSIAYLLNESEHIYWILDLEDEVHSIWVIWTSGLQSRWRTIGMKDNRSGWQDWVLKDNCCEEQDLWRITPWYWRNSIQRQLIFAEVGDIKEERRLGRDVGQPCPCRVGKDVKTFGGQRRRWAPPTSVTLDKTRWVPLVFAPFITIHHSPIGIQ